MPFRAMAELVTVYHSTGQAGSLRIKLGNQEASRRYDDKRVNNSKSNFIAYARPFVNGEITHYLRDKGFLISVPGRWRELHAKGQKLIREGTSKDVIPELLGITPIRWAEIVEACAVRVIAMNQIAEEEDLWV